ncbi:glycerophosphodiester phosphodiesterase [Streptomyces sp. NPDC088354]|uniref:glycerophosphodiester phosphodiesterase n=1 Tax=Streptomyces sp. NPDC088354 TaxID=3365856 RepID=UPI003810F807
MAALAVAHRGDPYRHRENTLPSLRSALRAGADAVEVDVRVTRDGVPVLLHDPTLTRLWGLDAALAELPSAALPPGVPTLYEALGAVEGCRALVDMTVPESAPAVLAAVRDAGAEDRTYYCGEAAAMLAVRDRDPAAEIALTWKTAAPVPPLLLTELRPRWINLRFGLVRSPLVAWARGEGLLVGAWTADLRRTMRRLERLGVDAITSNRIEVLLGELGGRPAPPARP